MTLGPTIASRAVDRPKVVNFIESAVDGEQDIPVLGFLGKLYLRRWLFAACVAVPTICSLVATALTPMTWVARTAILIRYGSSESAFLQNLIPDNRATLSGSTMGEMVRSLPTLIEAVKRYDIKPEDVFQAPSKVVFARLAGLLRLDRHEASSDPDDAAMGVAKSLQASLENGQSGSSAFSSKTQPVEILAKDSPVPQAQKGDELITLTLRSFNRDKVAAMTNGLAQTVIDTYYRMSAEDAHRSYEFLSDLAKSGDAAIKQLESGSDVDLSSLTGGLIDGAGNGPAAIASPTLTKLNGELADAQTALLRAQQFFGSDSNRIQRMTAEVDDLKSLIARQERIDAAKATLDQIKTRRFQALNTENLYRKRLVPISIIEPAVTPGYSSSAVVLRYAASAGTGLAVGALLGTALVIVLGLLDQRLFTPSDVERIVGLPTVGYLPKLKSWSQTKGFLPQIEQHALWSAETGLLQTLSHLDMARSGEFGSTVAIASPGDDEGKSLVALILAQTLARPGRCKVLLVDADPTRASITNHFNHMRPSRQAHGALPIRSMADLVVPSGVANLDILPVELIQENENVGFYLSRIRNMFAEAKRSYDLVVVDTPSSSASGEALMCCMAAESVLFVVRSGFSRALVVNGFLRKLREVAVHPQGVILNGRYGTLPAFFDRGV